MEAMEVRFGGVVADIEEERIEVEYHRLKPYDYEEESKQKKLNMLRDQSEEIQRKLQDMSEGMGQMGGEQSG